MSHYDIDAALRLAEFQINRHYAANEALEEAFEEFWNDTMPEADEETAWKAFEAKREQDEADSAADQYDSIVWENDYNDWLNLLMENNTSYNACNAEETLNTEEFNKYLDEIERKWREENE